jgi:nucleoid-associated protein YgaU
VQTGEIGAPQASPMPLPTPRADADDAVYAALIPDGRAFVEPPLTYIVQLGDSLIAISNLFFGEPGRVDDIVALNNIANPDHIVAGTTLLIPRS